MRTKLQSSFVEDICLKHVQFGLLLSKSVKQMNRTTRRTQATQNHAWKRRFAKQNSAFINYELLQPFCTASKSKRATFQTSGGGFNKEMEYAKGPIFYLTAAVQQTTEFARSKENGLLLMSFRLRCLRTHSPLFYHVVYKPPSIFSTGATTYGGGHDANEESISGRRLH